MALGRLLYGRKLNHGHNATARTRRWLRLVESRHLGAALANIEHEAQPSEARRKRHKHQQS
ncbi:hypothetical protein CFAM422_007188 [Trichoderma lentiforme]|uniref:Uncharacterized protein n=1 Tax=Trichoderma lentiforme TaxID=1567552 RepID=A0A9P4XBY1_9HYPO|nr:hypothetical protein CFAM422_007188 [Trichoderma lentiforme]